MERPITIDEMKPVELHSLRRLFEACRWDWAETDEEMARSFASSFRLFKAERNGELVGFGRVISDGKIYGFVVDLMVDPECRGQGVGQRLVEFIVDRCRKEGLKVLQLLASKEGRSLYLKCGFVTCPGDSPGMIKFLAAGAAPARVPDIA